MQVCLKHFCKNINSIVFPLAKEVFVLLVFTFIVFVFLVNLINIVSVDYRFCQICHEKN